MADATLKMLLLGEDRASEKFKKVGEAAGRAGDKVHGMSKVGKIAGLALAGGIGLAGAAMVDFVKEAARDQVSSANLAKQLHNSAHATNEQVAATQEWIAKQSEATGVAENRLRPALAKLVNATHDVGKAQRLTKLAMDVSAGSGKSLEAVSMALAKAQNGQMGGLARLGIKVQDSTKNEVALHSAQIKVRESTLKYTEAVKKYGAGSDQAKIAAQKLSLAHEKVGEAAQKAKKTTISFEEAQKRLADTFGGAASSKANTFQGRMDRLKVTLDITKKDIGNKLLPVLMTLSKWFLDKGLPAIQGFFGTLGRHRQTLLVVAAAAGTVAAAVIAYNVAVWAAGTATKVWTVVTKTGAAAQAVYNAVLGLSTSYLATWVGVKAIEGAAWVRSTAATVAATAGVVANRIATFASAAAAKAFAAAQWLVNAALDANPIGLVVLAIGALVVGLIYAYKHSTTFRNIVQGAFRAVGTAASFMWNNVLKPVFRFLITAWMAVAGAIIHGAAAAFGWVPGIGPKLKAAAKWFDGFRDSVNRTLNGIHDHTVKIYTNTDPAKAGIRAFINGLPQNTRIKVGVQAYVNAVQAHNQHNQHGAPGTNAMGTSFWRGGLTWVGEQGKELVNLPGGSQVIPNRESLAMTAPRGGGDTYLTVNVNGALDPVAVGKQIQTVLLRRKRELGGTLGLA